MYKEFDTIEDLYQWIEEDKNWTGAEANQFNRYPLRFVLFENFHDFRAFVDECQNHSVFVQSMEGWMAEGCDDQMLTNSQLARRFKEYVENIPVNDFVIAPFSEVTRFYENEKYAEFDSLLKTIRLIEASEDAQQNHQRIYVPIIGMQSKMGKFKNDPNIHIWEYHSDNNGDTYQLILSRGTTYGVHGLGNAYTLCPDLKHWISLWKNGTGIKQRIICTSKTIFDNAHCAQPDNAFEYTVCTNAYEFLKDGLGLDITTLDIDEEDLPYWEMLANEIDIDDFSFGNFINERFNAFSLENEKDFVQVWFEYKDAYSRWLLKMYYLNKRDNMTYLCRVLTNCKTQSTSELFSQMAIQIFDEPFSNGAINQRLVFLEEASQHGAKITDMAEQKLKAKLGAIAANPSLGVAMAMKYMTPLTVSEQELIITWLGQGRIERKEIKNLFPHLYYYTDPFSLQVDKDNLWINDYFETYRDAKIANRLTDKVSFFIKEKNASSTTFMAWHDQFKTVKTILYHREDIDVFYWIDGLGVDWIPFIVQIIKKHQVDGAFLNEIYVAIAELPTCTANNKVKLEELASGQLKKLGNIDSYAHDHKTYPSYLIKEFEIVEKCITDLLSQYNGKKIAIVSDHGISYLSQLASGMNLVNIDSDHSGRCGEWVQGSASKDNKYLVLEDGRTICALTHSSLTNKTPMGLGAHGGATPEEVLVPIIIISGKKNASNISTELMTTEVIATSPVLRYRIKGISSIDTPVIKYDDTEYRLHHIGNGIYESERLNLVDTARKVTIIIGDYKQIDTLSVNTGVDEDDLFGDL